MMTPRRAGFRKIDNDVFKALIAAKLSGGGYQIVLVVIDQTLGFQRESQKISLSYFQAMTGLSRQGVCNALRQVTNKGIIATHKSRGKKTVYALIRDYDRWTTSQPGFTSELVNKSLPNQSTGVYQTSQVPVSSSHYIKETLKETLKERGYDKEKDTISYQGGNEDTGNELKDNALTHPDAIEAFLQLHGPSPIKAISQATGIDRNIVNTALHNGKGKRFVHFPELRAWGVLTATEVKSSKDTLPF